MTGPFCSRLALAAHGVIAGTGVNGDIYVFLPVSKKRWGRQEFNAAWATPQDLDAVRRARRGGVTVRLYDPPASHPRPAILVHAGPSPAAGARAALAELIDQLRHHGWGLDDGEQPRLALCTQGTRDQCCAKWGFALYRDARALYDAAKFPFAPIQCSHLGGDRFAATGIVFPSGSMYGHLDRLPLPELAAAEADGRVLADHYRGRVFESPLTQVVRAGLAKDGHPVTTVSSITIEQADANPGPIKVVASGVRYDVFVERRTYAFFGDCRAAAGSRLSHDTRFAYDRADRVDNGHCGG